VIVKGLAESKTFQKFALRTHLNLEQVKKTGTEYMNQGIDEVSKIATEAAMKEAAAASGGGPPKPPLRGISGFFRAFGNEVRKDFGAAAK